MIRIILFDLSDVLVIGLTGIELKLQPYLHRTGDEILEQFRSEAMRDFLLGYCSEDEYLQQLKQSFGWEPSIDQLKLIIRQHFRTAIPGTREIVESLARRYPLYLLSDHGREWIQYIEAEHAFLGLFAKRFYSFELHGRKTDPNLYREVLLHIGAAPAECLFIDDRLTSLQAAGQVGISTILFEDASQLRDSLAAYSITLE